MIIIPIRALDSRFVNRTKEFTKHGNGALISMKFPTIKDIASDLRGINANVEGETDIRLQVYPDGAWCLRVGLSDYDQDHRGFWGASCIPGVNARGQVSRFNSMDLARDLVSLARDQEAQDREAA